MSDKHQLMMPVNVGRPKTLLAKFTPKKRKIVLNELQKEWNVSRAAIIAGIDRRAIYRALEQDENFKRAYDQLHDIYLDAIESVSVQTALAPGREGFQDRKLQLQAHRKEYAVKPVEINQAIQINIDNAPAEARQILDGMAVNLD